MRKNRISSLLAGIAVLGLVAAGCGRDDGATVRELEGGQGGSGSAAGGSGSGSGSASGAGSAAEAVPAGVAKQYATVNKEIAAEGGEKESGPWRVGYIVEPAEPWFTPDGQFRQPAPGETHHIEIVPFEAATGRIVPNVPIRLEVVGPGGDVVDAKNLEFFYSDEFFHYANNFSVPEAGRYTLRATLDAPTFNRHGEQGQGPALAEGARVEFTNVQLDPTGG